MQNGESITDFESAKIRDVSYYIDGKLNGILKEYSSQNGQLLVEEMYINDKRNGFYK